MIDTVAAVWDDVATSFTATRPEVAFFRLLIAGALGAMIGFEREVNNRPAGLRTHILIAMGACLFALVAFELIDVVQRDATAVSGDPLRLISAITSGAAFLAAGSIITSGGRVQGLTTGAGMWMAGAIGLACGIGRIGLAAMATVLVLAVLLALSPLKRKLGQPDDVD